jgi:hypothetical protein
MRLSAPAAPCSLPTPRFTDAVNAFLDSHCRRVSVCEALLAVAGPVDKDRCVLTNSPWTIDAPELGAAFGLRVSAMQAILTGGRWRSNLNDRVFGPALVAPECPHKQAISELRGYALGITGLRCGLTRFEFGSGPFCDFRGRLVPSYLSNSFEYNGPAEFERAEDFLVRRPIAGKNHADH